MAYLEPGDKLISVKNLQTYHNTLIRYLSDKVRFVPTNICSQCGGLIGQNNTCDYCGTKYRLVLSEESEETK